MTTLPAHLASHPALLSVESWGTRVCQECPGSAALTAELGVLGLRPSHGICDACAPAWRAKMLGGAEAFFTKHPVCKRG